LEVEFDWAMSDSDRLRGHFTWLDTEIVSDFVQQWAFAATDLYQIDQAASVDPTNTLIRANLKGNELPSSPKFSINLNYSHDFNLSYGALIQPWAGVNWRDDSYYSYFNVDRHTEKFVTDTPEAFSDTRPAVTYVNLGIKYVAPDDKWNLEAFVNNATNEVDFYWASGGDGLIKGPVSMPRFYGIRANYNF
jgi:iron complex outermembrane recepter protein